MFEPQRVVFAWDRAPYWRQRIWRGYKQRRRKDNEEDRQDVYVQVDLFKQVLKHIGVCQVELPTMEADDIAGILTSLVTKQSNQEKIILLSGDKDWFQLLGPRVKQVRSWKGKKLDVWTEERVFKEHGVTVSDWPKFLALVGDSSDNIPNVRKGMGPVAALRVLAGITTLGVGEQTAYTRNLQLTTVLRSPPTGIKEIAGALQPIQRTAAGWEAMEATLKEYELFDLWKARQRLWVVGGWGNPQRRVATRVLDDPSKE